MTSRLKSLYVPTLERHTMELSKEEIRDIKSTIESWKTQPNTELEATFGYRGVVDQQTFLRVTNRLRSKGYQAISQEDRLTIKIKQDNLRFTLSGTGVISQYCKDNTLEGKSYIVIVKEPVHNLEEKKKSNIDLKEYNVRIKSRKETDLTDKKTNDPRVIAALQTWNKHPKYFRLIRRWSYMIHGIQFDLSMVRSPDVDSKTGGLQLLFQEPGKPIISNLPPKYEIEVELDRSGFPKDSDPDAPFKSLIQGMGDVLRGIQNCPILTRTSTKEAVLEGYKNLIGTPKFRGVAPVTLELRNMTKEVQKDIPNIRSNYNVTDKADGLRVHGFTDKDGELFMIDMTMNVYRTGYKNPSCNNALLDGEYVTQDKLKNPIQALLFFDIYHDKKDVTDRPFMNPAVEDADTLYRYKVMNDWMKTWNSGKISLLKSNTLHVAIKEFRFPDQSTTIFQKAAEVLDRREARNYYTDGLIFTPNLLPIPINPGVGFEEQFKWKPAEDNSIDFLAITTKDPSNKAADQIDVTIHPQTFETVRYKTLNLLVGSSQDPIYRDPRTTILNELPLPTGRDSKSRTKYKPVPFIPKEFADSNAALCYVQTQIDPKTNEEYISTEQDEVIRDKCIIEMRYDTTKPPGWRWIPSRIRTDKTERLLQGQIGRTLNSDKTAESIWNSIHEPITLHMIRTGSETPSDHEIKEFNIQTTGENKKYFERKAPVQDLNKVAGLRKFHNIYIKDTILYGFITAKEGEYKSLLDLTVGKASDIQRWRRSNLSFILGTDIVEDNIRNTEDGAYRRLLDTLIKNKQRKQSDELPVPTMFFVTADSSQRLLDGSAGENEEERDILRSILGRVEPLGPLPPAVTHVGKGVLSKGASVVSCMHSLHYFFESSSKFNGFLQNIADNLQIGGYFIGTNFDGDSVFELLRNTETGTSRVGMNGDTVLWEIEKQYSAEELPNDDSVFGMAVNVYFISIGIKHKEYLIPWNFLVAKLKTIGCELVGNEELAQAGLNHSSNLYSASYAMAMDAAKKDSKFKQCTISDKSVQDFSFLNRWYIFKRTSQGTGQIGKLIGDIEEEEDQEEEQLETNKEELAALSAKVQASASGRGDLMSSIVPGSAAAASQMLARIEEAEERGARDELRILNAEANELRRKEAESQGLPIPRTLKGGPPGSSAKAFVATVLGQGAAVLTVPVIRGGDNESYKAVDIFQFHEKSEETPKYLTLPGKYTKFAARHLAPNAPFRIYDSSDKSDKTEYSSITHFLAGMKFKYASKNPELAKSVFSREGSIHSFYLTERLAAQKGKPVGISQDTYNQSLLNETTRVKTDEQKYMNMKDVEFNETSWASKKDALLRDAVIQRFTNDKWFCEIISAALAQRKYLLYFDEKAKERGSELGGSRSIKGTIHGQNKYGKLLMELANTLSDKLKACLMLPDPF